ncbi:MAG: hypothetical protein MUF00_16950, partial [Gemmatimonadaceae bacterium]|nr:hypothetical protein [Gemmatimonadaceae bacterium]
MSAAVPVVVTGVGGGGFGEQLLKALRLADRRYEIIATDTTALSKGFARSDVRYVVPRAGDADYVPALLAACRRHAAVAVLPGSEPELRALSAARDQFAAQGIFLPINPAGVIDICLDKDRTSAFLEAHGFRVPHTVRIDTVDDLARVDRFPSVLKPSVGGGGSADVTIAQDEHELLAFGRYLLASGRQLIAQEYVGTGEQEFTVGVLCTMDGELLNSIAVRRLTMSGLSNRVKVPNRTGRTALGDTLVISSGV